MFCPNCGHEIPDSSAFCPYCGQPIEKEDIPEEVETKDPENSTSDSESSSAYREAPQTNPYVQNPKSSDSSFSSKSKSKKKLGIIIGIVIAVLIAAASGYYVMNQKKNDPIGDLKTMEFDDYSNRPIGKYFENFFTNCQWSTFHSDDHDYVRFTGIVNNQDIIDNVKVEMDFKLNKDHDACSLTKTLIDDDNYHGEYQEDDLLDLVFKGTVDATDGPKDQGDGKANIKKISDLAGSYEVTDCIIKDEEYSMSDLKNTDEADNVNFTTLLTLKSNGKYTFTYGDLKTKGTATLKNHKYWHDLVLNKSKMTLKVDLYGRIQMVYFSANAGLTSCVFGTKQNTSTENDSSNDTSNEGDPSDVDDAMNDSDGYLLPYVDSEYLTDDDLADFSEYQLKLAKNEIYARHGYLFKNSTLDAYFRGKSWYSHMVNVSDETTHDASVVEGRMNSIEKANLDFIVEYAKDKGYSI